MADDTQRLEELAIKKSRQLIPVTPSSPKTSVGVYVNLTIMKAVFLHVDSFVNFSKFAPYFSAHLK